MTLSSLVNQIKESNLTSQLIERITRTDRLVIQGGNRTSRALITTALAKKNSKNILVVVPTMEEATRWYSILESLGWTKAYIYPTSEASPYEKIEPTSEITWGQLNVLSDLLIDSNNNDIAIVATERALQPHLPPKHVLIEKCMKLEIGMQVNIEDLSILLTELGYKKSNTTDQEGYWSRRGDIIDIYPVSCELPIRLELFGDEIDKLKEYDPITQRSLDSIKTQWITPTGISPLIALELKESKTQLPNTFITKEEINDINDGKIPEGIRRLLPFAWNNPSSLLEYISHSFYVITEESSQGIAHGRQWYEHVQEHFDEIYNPGKKTDSSQSVYPYLLHKDVEECYTEIQRLEGFDLKELTSTSSDENVFNIASEPPKIYPNQFGNLSEIIKKHQKVKFSTYIYSAQPSRSVALLEEHDCVSKFIVNPNDFQSINSLTAEYTPVALKAAGGSYIEGFILSAWNILLITDKEFFGQQSLETTGYIRRRKRSTSKTIDPKKVLPGDFVVHRNHGIGKFIKIEKFNISGDSRDYLVVEYLDGTLRVAADQLGSLARYRGTSDSPPKMNRMGGKSWNNSKERVRKILKKVALDLVSLYAERQNSKGFSFPPDGPWQNELEDSFAYEPTPDQIKAIRDVKLDMENNSPMDRLVCGDVGFGKTEVAIRAIFKAITAGKQIALLTPTTILAQQHWRTLADRFAPYPIKVELLNRFKTQKEKSKILDGLIKGTTDAVVGTHQLLSNKVKFNNLGLLVVDEEQRFGVNQKEKIKSIRMNIDVLTLSATPIPRTLHMSLSGVREMSLITTPPPARRSIKTHISPLDDEVIRSAVKQELDRGGQVFYVVPRIENIEKVADRLKVMIPNINLIIAHGQMDEGELEKSMVSFNSGLGDIMLCTTIIESGLDIPKVNTIIIENAQNFGLSQLYQLRGRVGRSGIQAHAWLFYPSELPLSDTARRRLRAIQEFAQLGSGFQLAMRDMEIRGVGNLLGIEQSGQMETIGFDLYMEMLQEAISDVQGQNIPTVDDTQIDIPINAFIPGDWITDSEEKISAYRAAADCLSTNELLELAILWKDRYGTLPQAVEALLQIMKLKLIAKKCGFSRISSDKANIILETPMEEPAFKILKEGLPNHLRGRLIYKSTNPMKANIIARGLGILSHDKQLEQLMEWINLMAEQIPDNNGISKNQREIIFDKKNDKVIKV